MKRRGRNGWLRRRIGPDRREEGLTLVELAVSMAGLAVVASIMIMFFVGVTRVDRVHETDDTLMTTLRDARQAMSRDVREARSFFQAEPGFFTVWLDRDWDNRQEIGEFITWQVREDGTLDRTVSGEATIEIIDGLDPTGSGFTYDSSSTLDIRSMTVDLVADSGGIRPGDRSLDFEVSLRNLP